MSGFKTGTPKVTSTVTKVKTTAPAAGMAALSRPRIQKKLA